MRGTLLNTATVAVGATVGLVVGRAIPNSYQDVALHGLGLVTVGLAIRMILQGKNPLISALALTVGGSLGLAIGIHDHFVALAEWAKTQTGQGQNGLFAQGMVTSFVLFCIGPMTLLGCLEDALENKIDLLAVKSTLDGIAAIFLAAASGAGVLATAPLLLIFQGGLTLLAKPLSGLSKDEEAMAELVGTGGAILLATGIGLLGIRDFHTANYLPAVFLAPAIVILGRKLPKIPKEKV